ncbi:MAG: gamma-glutamyl-gamma-aminobutyrate hydrolase family protein [Planctomycetes bacterium]|nr:gamma-glutamyl-gamma-aminobutyrate hydrolase family protein [Planctomycetota bacterium]
MRPLIGITSDFRENRFRTKSAYVECVLAAGGLPVLLPHADGLLQEVLERLDAVVLTGGADIDVRPFGHTLHPQAEIMDARRQQSELALLAALEQRADLPVLGICLGMQLMGVQAGATLIQHLPDVVPGSECHQDDRLHAVECEFGNGPVTSFHHQALANGGSLKVSGHAPDGVIEAVRDPQRRFYWGVQWHPERTQDPRLGLGVIRALVEAAEQFRLKAKASAHR